MPPRTVSGKRVLVTGAASGIGRATAIACARRGARLFLTDLNAAPLDAVADEIGGAVEYVEALDISDYDAVAAAGRGGHLVNVSSAAGLFGLPWHAPYSATKFGLRGLSEVLRFDLRRHDIGVSLVCPGAVETGLVDTVEIAGIDRHHPQIERFSAHFRRRAIAPETAAERIIRGIERDRYWVYTSDDIRLAYFVQRCCEPLYRLSMRVANDRFTKIALKARVKVGNNRGTRQEERTP